MSTLHAGVTVGSGDSSMKMSKFEYADDAARLVDDDAATATTRVTAIAAGSLNDAAMVISEKKSKAMHIVYIGRPGWVERRKKRS